MRYANQQRYIHLQLCNPMEKRPCPSTILWHLPLHYHKWRRFYAAFIFLLALSIWNPSLNAQNFAEPDRLAIETPPAKTKNIPTLAQYLSSGFSTEKEKARAIFAWVSLNIIYIDSTDERELWATPEHLLRQKPENVLDRKSTRLNSSHLKLSRMPSSA